MVRPPTTVADVEVGDGSGRMQTVTSEVSSYRRTYEYHHGYEYRHDNFGYPFRVTTGASASRVHWLRTRWPRPTGR